MGIPSARLLANPMLAVSALSPEAINNFVREKVVPELSVSICERSIKKLVDSYIKILNGDTSFNLQRTVLHFPSRSSTRNN
jgi:hypothetical protein